MEMEMEMEIMRLLVPSSDLCFLNLERVRVSKVFEPILAFFAFLHFISN